jgi:hypothetical protein
MFRGDASNAGQLSPAGTSGARLVSARCCFRRSTVFTETPANAMALLDVPVGRGIGPGCGPPPPPASHRLSLREVKPGRLGPVARHDVRHRVSRLDVLKWGEGPGDRGGDCGPRPRRVPGAAPRAVEPPRRTMALSMWGDLSDDGWSLSFHREVSRPSWCAARGGHSLHGFDLQSMDLGRLSAKTKAPGAPVIGLVGVNPVRDAAPPLVDYGPIRVETLGEVKVGGVPCRRYRLVGKGFTVLTWFSRADGRVVRAESTRPDSHDWTSFKLQLLRTEPMDPFAWQSFRRKVLSRFVRPSAPPAPRRGGLARNTVEAPRGRLERSGHGGSPRTGSGPTGSRAGGGRSARTPQAWAASDSS